MTAGVPLAWLQLTRQPRRLLIAVTGMVMSSLGILCQMGFEDSLFRSATRLYAELDADLVIISPQYQFMVLPEPFSERRLYQAQSVAGVESFTSVRLGIAPFRNPVTTTNRNVYVVGVSRRERVFTNPDWARKLRALEAPDEVLFDARSRPEFGPVGELFRAGPVRTEIANQEVRIADVFGMGASFSADGTVLVTDDGFSRLFTHRRPGMVDLAGLVHLAPGASATDVRDLMRATLPADVVVLTHAELNHREQAYWRGTTPAGFTFSTVLIVSLFVGCVSAYQILYSDIAENLRQYATLRAIGYPDRFFVRLTIEKAWLLSSLKTRSNFCSPKPSISATRLTLVPLVMTPARVVAVYLIMFAASAAAGLLAMQRLRRTDLSELF